MFVLFNNCKTAYLLMDTFSRMVTTSLHSQFRVFFHATFSQGHLGCQTMVTPCDMTSRGPRNSAHHFSLLSFLFLCSFVLCSASLTSESEQLIMPWLRMFLVPVHRYALFSFILIFRACLNLLFCRLLTQHSVSGH